MRNAWILNVDADDQSRSARSALLREAGFSVLDACDASAAVGAAASNDIAVAIVKSQLPDSIDFSNRLKTVAANKNLQIAQIASPAEQWRLEHAALPENGADLYLPEPATPLVLISSIRMLLRVRGCNGRPTETLEPGRRFRALADEATIGIVTCGLDGSISYVNHAFAAMISPNLQVTVSHWRHIAGDDAFLKTRFSELREKGSCAPFETVLIDHQGNLFPVLVSAKMLDGESGAAYVTDLRPVRDAEQALRNSEERRLLALDAAEMGTWFWDITRNDLIWDRRCRELFGLEPSEPMNYDKFLSLVHPDDRERTDTAVRSCLENLTDYNVEYRVISTSEERWISAKGRAYVGPDGKVRQMQGIAIDITARKKAQERLTQLYEALQRSNQDLQEFAYAISHDLQEPVRMVNNFGALIKKRHSDLLTGEASEFFDYMRDAAERMDRMIRDLLSYSRVLHDQGTFVQVELRAALLWALGNLEVVVQENQAVITHDDLPTIHGDFVRISQVFQNLLSNAMQYRREESPKIHISARQNGCEWLIGVKDNGLGMDPRYASRAFGVFRRLHGSQYPGTGVGLAICKRIVERHGGRIWVETNAGQGSEFLFTLPVADQPL